MPRSHKLDKSIILLVLIVLIIIGTVMIFLLQVRTDKITEHIKKNEEISVLFLVNEGEDLLFAETFMFQPGTNKGAVFDIPLDVGVVIEKIQKIDRIDLLYKKSDVTEFKSEIEDLLGLNIPYYMQIDIDDLVGVVDLLDSVNVFSASSIEVVSDDLVLIPSGSVSLDGDKAKIYLKYSNEEETDLEPIGRKQKFTKALLGKMGEKSAWMVRDDFFELISEKIECNWDDDAMLSFCQAMSGLDTERIVFQRVLGAERVVDGKKLLFPHYEGNLLKKSVSQTRDSIKNPSVVSDEDVNISIEILNGTDRNGLASRTSQVFADLGYEIDRVDNAEHFGYKNTVVINHREDPVHAQGLADVIRCKNIINELKVDFGTGTGADVTIIIGEDFDGRYCKN